MSDVIAGATPPIAAEPVAGAAAASTSPPSQAPREKLRIAWYRCPVSREQLADLNRRSDFRGLLQTGGYLGVLAITGSAAAVLMQPDAAHRSAGQPPRLRLCCRTMILNPVLEFLYWHMNYHTEHHMYAAVPCYHLRKLHRLVGSDLPECSRGLRATWKQILGILRQQKIDPTYQFQPTFPPTVAPPRK